MFKIPSIRHNARFTTSAHGFTNPFKLARSVTDTFCRFLDPGDKIHVRCYRYLVHHGLVSPKVKIQGSQVGGSRQPIDWSASTDPAIRISPIKVFSNSVAKVDKRSIMLKPDVSA